jgi:hypothetical protein
MGALTLKSFPFELRGWDIEKFESFDPTDGFGSNTKIYLSKNQIIQIEPNFNTYSHDTWLTDKGRQFFDSIFNIKQQRQKSLFNYLNNLIKNIYIFDHCNNLINKKYFFILVFENLNIEISNLLLLLSQNYSFIKLRRSQNFLIKNDFESDLQLNTVANKIQLNSSTLCFLIATNPRYEGYYLNLNLRQRFLKGNFKCFMIGSLTNLTFPISFLGSNIIILRTISEGNNLTCQNLKFSKNPLIIYNTRLFKRNDGKNLIEMLKFLTNYSIYNKTWNSLNILNSSISETGFQTLFKLLPLAFKDLTNFNSIYFIDTSINNISNIKKITKLKLLNYNKSQLNLINKNKLILDQNNLMDNNFSTINQIFLNKNIFNYFYLPNTLFYEKEETFINVEGFIKRSPKLLSTNKLKNNWQILKKMLKVFKKKLVLLNKKNNTNIFFNLNKIFNFKKFINFIYYAVQNLTHLNFYLVIKNKPIYFTSNLMNFKRKTLKINQTKLKYWLDDFFTGNNDEYSQYSKILTKNSKILRIESTNFF